MLIITIHIPVYDNPVLDDAASRNPGLGYGDLAEGTCRAAACSLLARECLVCKSLLCQQHYRKHLDGNHKL